jgi:hypothetical protein
MKTENPKIVRNLTALSAIGLAMCSGGLSISFGLTLADNVPLKILFGFMLLGLAVGEFLAAFYLAKAWNSGQVIKIALAIYLMLGGIGASILCGQAMLQQSLDAAQQTRRMQSDVYQAAVAQRKQAAEKVAALSMDESQALAAQNALTTLETEKQAYLASAATNSRGQGAGTIGVRVGDCTGTSYYVKKYCGQIRRLDSQIREAKTTADKWNAYKNAKAFSDELESKPLPNAVKEAELPGISAIALLLETDGEHVGAILFFCLSVLVETAALILFVFLGTESEDQKAEGVSTTQPYILPQHGMVYTTQPYIVTQPQQSQMAQAGVVSTTPNAPQPQQQPQMAQTQVVSTTPPYIVAQPQQSEAAQTRVVSTTPPYIVAQPQQSQMAQVGVVSTTQPYIVAQPQQSEVAQTGVVSTTPPVAQPQQSEAAQTRVVSTTPPNIVAQPQQPEAAQAGVVSTTPPNIVAQSQQQSEVAQAGVAPTTPPNIVAQSQQQSEVAQTGVAPTTPPERVPQSQLKPQVQNLSENLPQNAVPSVYQQVVDDIHAKKLPNGSFRTLMNRYGINQNQATVIRLKLVEDGKAKFNRRHELDLVESV